jgi:hypothetical protein
MPAKPENLSISELKAKLKLVAEQTRESMAEMLYWLREKLKAQGARNDLRRKKEGFEAWCEANLYISRRTADRWATEWAEANGKKKKSRKRTSGHRGRRSLNDAKTGPPKITFNLPLLLNEGEHEELMWAVETIGEDEVARLVFKMVTEKAKELEGPRPGDPFQLPPKRPAASSANATILEDLEAKQLSAGRV